MPYTGIHCAVRGCTNNHRRLTEWLDQGCVIHPPDTKGNVLLCMDCTENQRMIVNHGSQTKNWLQDERFTFKSLVGRMQWRIINVDHSGTVGTK